MRKNYYLYEENEEHRQEGNSLLGSVRMTQKEEQWILEIQWKEKQAPERFLTETGSGLLQIKIQEKEIRLKRLKEVQKRIENQTQNDRIKSKETESLKVEGEENIKEIQNVDIEEDSDTRSDTDSDEEEGKEKDSLVMESVQIPSETTEWERIRQSCPKVEACSELGEVYRVDKGNFVVLPEAIRDILQNSFLVHGLMNYGYLLLFRVDERAEQIGVGVPGVYYEKEKLVAEMFGFPQFWCHGKSDNGKFGYYLRIVS